MIWLTIKKASLESLIKDVIRSSTICALADLTGKLITYNHPLCVLQTGGSEFNHARLLCMSSHLGSELLIAGRGGFIGKFVSRFRFKEAEQIDSDLSYNKNDPKGSPGALSQPTCAMG